MSAVVEQWYRDRLIGVWQRRQTLPHALLLSGPAGIGKSTFAQVLAAGLLCRRAAGDGFACGECQSCRLLQAGTHPDYYRLELEGRGTDKQAKEIKVDQVRQLCQSLAQTSQLGGYKIAVIDPAERMNRNAANSLLKTLEEPTAGTLLILVTSAPSALLPTIRSRCQQLPLQPPPRDLILRWLNAEFPAYPAEALLAATGGGPLTAAALTETDALEQRQALFEAFRDIAQKRQDPLLYAAKTAKGLSAEMFSWLLSWVQDLICIAAAGPAAELGNVDLQKDLQALATRIDLQKLFGFYDKVDEAMSLLRSSVSVQLLFESLMLEWSARTNP